MPEKTLYIELFQPFAQYRNPFTFYYAQTYPLPPKSTIIGMLQNLINDYYGHELGVDDWWRLKISIHGGFESIFWNYQQLIKGETAIGRSGLINRHDRNPLGNIWHPLYHFPIKAQRTPVYQQELFNGHLFVFVKGNKDLIEQIKASLENPKKVLYLGRSEDVIFLKTKPKILEDEGIMPKPKSAKRSLWLSYPTYIKRDDFPIKNEKYPVYSIPTRVIFKNNGIPIKSKAEISKSTEREVDFETVIYTGFDYIVKLSKPVEFEEFNINGQIFKIISDFGWL